MLARVILLGLALLFAQQGLGVLAAGYEPYQTDHGDAQPFVPYCVGSDGAVAPCGPDAPLSVLGMPFQRAGDPFLLPATTTPQQYQLAQPLGTRSYRGVNPCGVDIRIKTVASMGSTVTATTGTRFLARTAETLASSPSPTGQNRIVSIMTVGDPGAGGCVFELGYGNGG